MRPSLLSLPLLIATSGCIWIDGHGHGPGHDPDDGVDSGSDGLEEDTGDTAEPEPGFITGDVEVELYTYDEAGELVWTDWAERYGDVFPFGAIYVAAYALDEDTLTMNYLDEVVLHDPLVGPNPYELEVAGKDVGTVRVYAQLDYWADGILGTYEPMGVWPDVLELEPGETIGDVDIDIPVSWYDFSQPGGVWNPDDYVLLTGEGLVTDPYAGGSCTALWYHSDGSGPWYADAFTPEVTDGGAIGEFGLYVAKNWGAGSLLGAWDSNFNGLIDPADEWGSYVDETGASLNPLVIGTENLSDLTIMIPDGLGTRPSAVPFVVLGGEVGYGAGFAALGSSAKVYVAAMKYRPVADLAVSDIPAYAYDYQVYEQADLSGDRVPFSLITPADTLVYLWAYADVDGDGNVNEPGEAVASYGGDTTGRLATGDSSWSDIVLALKQVK